LDNISLADASLLGDRSRARLQPLLSDAIAAGGGVVVAFGLLLIGINEYANTSSRWPGALLFAGLAVVAYFLVGVVPGSVRPSCIAAFAVAVPVCFGFIFIPKVHSFGDLRPFFFLTIGVWVIAWIVPRTTARPLFIALALLLFWLWMLGEVAGTSAYSPSAAPVPAPPYLTAADFSHRAAQVSINQLDPNDPLYPTARECANGDNAACDSLYNSADPGTLFSTFGRTCGGRQPGASGGECDLSSSSPTPRFGGLTTSRPRDKTTEIGVVSTLLGIIYLGALMLLDRNRYLGLGTAFVIPGILALQSGVSALGDRSRHLWVGGMLVLVTGLLIGVLGEGAHRRFTTWYGGYTASLGALLIGLDTANVATSISHTHTGGGGTNAKLIGPGLIIIVFGVALVGLALAVAHTVHLGRARPAPPGAPPLPVAPVPVAPVPVAPWGSVGPAPSPPSSPSPAPPSPAPPPPTAPPPTWPPGDEPRTESPPTWPPKPDPPSALPPE
jgi:hypothetical protein